MKPKRPTETDLLALVQNGFNSQLPKDREAQTPAPVPKADEAPALAQPLSVQMVRITLAIPEDLRYRLQLVLMGHRRKNRSRMTQDEYCAKALCAQLDQDEGSPDIRNQLAKCTAFLRDCLREGALTKGWAPKAKALLGGLGDCDREKVPHNTETPDH